MRRVKHDSGLGIRVGFAVIAGAIVLSACRPAHPVISPLPPRILSLEGHASFNLSRAGESGKSRFSFVFVLPDRGRIDVGDPFGRTISQLFFDREEASLVLPRKRAYWKASRAEVMSKLVGFDLSPEDIMALLSGNAKRLEGWTTEEDIRGRIVRGVRGDLGFDIHNFYGRSSLPTLIVFSRPPDEGRLRIHRLTFNQPLMGKTLLPPFLEDPTYESASWEKIEQWLKNER